MQEEDSEDSDGRQAAGNEQSEEEADSIHSPAKTPPKQCVGLQDLAPPAAPGSAESRMQLKQALKEQIEDLRVQQAAAAMQKLNPLL